MDHWICPGCNKKIAASLKKCPHCGTPEKEPTAIEKAAANISKRTAAAVDGYKEESERIALAKEQREYRENNRKCLNCGYTGQMKTWLGDTFAGILIAGILLCMMILPGIIFIAYFWGKRRCPSCGAIGKNAWADV